MRRVDWNGMVYAHLFEHRAPRVGEFVTLMGELDMDFPWYRLKGRNGGWLHVVDLDGNERKVRTTKVLAVVEERGYRDGRLVSINGQRVPSSAATSLVSVRVYQMDDLMPQHSTAREACLA